MKILKSNYLILLCTCFACGASLAAQDTQLHDMIRAYILEQADVAVGQRLAVDVGHIDTAIASAMCNEGARLTLPNKTVQRNTTVKVVCESPQPWQIYVPVRVTWEQPVLVASVPLAPGQSIGPDNSEIAWIDSVQLRGGTFNHPEQIAGARVKRRLQQGQPISGFNICLICKGDNVTIIARTSGLEIKTSGEALSDANTGDTVYLSNSRSHKRVSARVISAGLAEVNL